MVVRLRVARCPAPLLTMLRAVWCTLLRPPPIAPSPLSTRGPRTGHGAVRWPPAKALLKRAPVLQLQLRVIRGIENRKVKQPTLDKRPEVRGALVVFERLGGKIAQYVDLPIAGVYRHDPIYKAPA